MTHPSYTLGMPQRKRTKPEWQRTQRFFFRPRLYQDGNGFSVMLGGYLDVGRFIQIYCYVKKCWMPGFWRREDMRPFTASDGQDISPRAQT